MSGVGGLVHRVYKCQDICGAAGGRQGGRSEIEGRSGRKENCRGQGWRRGGVDCSKAAGGQSYSLRKGCGGVRWWREAPVGQRVGPVVKTREEEEAGVLGHTRWVRSCVEALVLVICVSCHDAFIFVQGAACDWRGEPLRLGQDLL